MRYSYVYRVYGVSKGVNSRLYWVNCYNNLPHARQCAYSLSSDKYKAVYIVRSPSDYTTSAVSVRCWLFDFSGSFSGLQDGSVDSFLALTCQ